MGRFMSPDWSAQVEPVPYAKLDDPQSLNLYAYVRNNPLVGIDVDGHDGNGDQDWMQKNHPDLAAANSQASWVFSGSIDWGQVDAAKAVQQQNQVQTLVNAQNAAMSNPNYAPNTPTAGTTHCNQGTNNIADATGMNTTGILSDSHGNALPANTQISNLANPDNGYHAVSSTQAQQLANSGTLVFGTQVHDPHGHIVTVRPEGLPGDNPRGRSGPLLANIGVLNGVAHQSAVFTPVHGAIVYYAPNQ
jgi:hypothetical protein